MSATHQRHHDGHRVERRRFRLLAGAVVALTVLLNVAPAAANHLRVKTSDIETGAVTTPKLRDGTVREATIANGAVSTPKQVNDSVRPSTIRDGAVGRSKLGPRATTAHAYAEVFWNGQVNPDVSRNIADANVDVHEPGWYCFRDLPFEPTLAVATLTSHLDAGETVHLAVVNEEGSHLPCPTETQMSVNVRSSYSSERYHSFNVVIF